MPSNVVKSFAEKSGKSVAEVEKLWSKAKSIVKKEYPDIEPETDRWYSLVTGTLKKMVGLKESSAIDRALCEHAHTSEQNEMTFLDLVEQEMQKLDKI
jgi:hypothetical protein